MAKDKGPPKCSLSGPTGRCQEPAVCFILSYDYRKPRKLMRCQKHKEQHIKTRFGRVYPLRKESVDV